MRPRRRARASLAVAALLSLCAACALASPAARRGVEVALRPRWQGTSVVHEVAEFLASEKPESFWRYVELTHDARGADARLGSDRQCVDAALARAARLLPGALAPVLSLSLSVREYSPRLAAHRSAAMALPGGAPRGCCAARVGGQVVTRLERLSAAIEAEAARAHGDRSCSSAGGGSGSSGADAGESAAAAAQGSWLEPTSSGLGQVYPAAGSSSTAAVAVEFFATPGASCFGAFHTALKAAAESGSVRYTLLQYAGEECVASLRGGASGVEGEDEDEGIRVCALVGEGDELALSGFGVELAIKSMEYKAIDDKKIQQQESADRENAATDDLSVDTRGFNFATLIERTPDKRQELLDFRAWLLATAEEGAADGAALQVWDLKDLGLQASQRITSASSHPLRILQDVAQNFPTLAPSLSRVRVPIALADEVAANGAIAPGGMNLVAINGVIQNLDTMDAFSLLSLARSEIRAHAALTSLGLASGDASQALALRPLETAAGGGGAGATRLNITGAKGTVVTYNNIERDPMYSSWPDDPQYLLMPTHGLPKVRKNFFTAVFVLDPAAPSAASPLGLIGMYVEGMVPVRFGVVLTSPEALGVIRRIGIDSFMAATSNDAADSSSGRLAEADIATLRGALSLRVTRAFLLARKELGRVAAWNFLIGLAGAAPPDPYALEYDDEPPAPEPVTEERLAAVLRAQFEDAAQADAALESLVSGDAFLFEAAAMSAHAAIKGLTDGPAMLLNGRVFLGEGAEDYLGHALQDEMRVLQQLTYYGVIKRRSNVLNKILETGCVQRYSSLVINGDAAQRVAPVAEALGDKPPVSLRFLRAPALGEGDTAPTTHMVVLHFDVEGRGNALANAVLTHMRSSTNATRLAFVLNPPGDAAASGAEAALAGAKSLDAALAALRGEASEPAGTKALAEHARISRVLGLAPGEMALIVNGKVYAVDAGASVHAEDVASIDASARASFGDEVATMFDASGVASAEARSHRLLLASAVAMKRQSEQPQAGQSINIEVLSGEHVLIEENAGGVDGTAAVLDVRAVLNPLSREVQKLAPVLTWLRNSLPPQSMALKVYLNPKTEITDLPLKSYYRFAAPDGLAFDAEGALLPGPTVSFGGLPEGRTLTMNMDVPERWLVEPVRATYDLDNLRLEDLPADQTTVSVGFELEALLVTGSCIDPGASRREQHPQGLQLQLGTLPRPTDTVVMQNLGYFQLKAPAPGVWPLSLAAGRSSELYSLDAGRTTFSQTTDGSLYDVADGMRGVANVDSELAESIPVTVDSFQPDFVFLHAQRRPGTEDKTLLAADGDAQQGNDSSGGGGLFSWFGGAKNGGGDEKAVAAMGGGGEDDNGKINIFSLCSGHLYERFMRIMILSVLDQTKTPVKFWLIKNYLSPAFKEVLPAMARELGFEYELITYKWPTFLNKQTEKMRIVWAYKILFLDVLFPVTLKRVIFVDADQIVRTDMKELMQMDLGGAVYGYTPFCDNNEEMVRGGEPHCRVIVARKVTRRRGVMFVCC